MVIPFSPILVFHFFKDLQHHPISGFNLTISLWVVWCRSSMLDVIRLSQVLHVFVYERGPIVTNQSLRDPECCNDVFSNEVCHGCSSGFFQRDSFYSFCKVLGGCQDPYVTIGRRIYRLYKQLLLLGYSWPTMKSDFEELVRTCHACQILGDAIHTHLNVL